MIGERLKAAMIMRGMTQKELADKAGLAEPTISRYCNNSRGIFDNLENLCKILGVSADYLLGLDSRPTLEVVRCKDCEYWWKENELCKNENTLADYITAVCNAKPEHYCGYGKRRIQNGRKEK